MGKRVTKRNYDAQDFAEFYRRVKCETDFLVKWCQFSQNSSASNQCGFELELFLLNQDHQLSSNNIDFIKTLHQDWLITEAVQSTVELNVPFIDLQGHALTQHRETITNLLQQCCSLAAQNNQHILMAGTVPSSHRQDYQSLSLTNENRYHAIHNRLQFLRDHVATKVKIHGIESAEFLVDSFALVGAISSFQIHFRAEHEKMARLYNTSLAISAPMIAISANSPYLFSKALWMESRIPFYEQILKTQHRVDRLPRVTFGTGYITSSLGEVFQENYLQYQPLLPQLDDSNHNEFFHLQMHNGNIYRWNRPVLDFDQNHQPYFRVEHRPLPAGPSIIDMLANAAFYFGLTHYFIQSATPLEQQVPFQTAKQNFYAAAQYGLAAGVQWDHYHGNLLNLIQTILIPKAREGLHQLDINPADIQWYLSIIEERLAQNKTGSQWQIDFMNRNKNDFHSMVERYLAHQRSGKPVHEWPRD